MIAFPKSRLFGLIGSPRAGKDSVAKYLQETRGFATFAFADRIKEEFGISKEDFEIAKISGNIDKVRRDLWEFSEKKKANDPSYFVRKVLADALNNHSSVITDIRTKEEFDAIVNSECQIKRIYYVTSSDFPLVNDFVDNNLRDSKLDSELIVNAINNGFVRIINNKDTGLYYFYKYLDNFFVKEDIMDLPDAGNSKKFGSMVSDYLSQFDFTQKRS